MPSSVFELDFVFLSLINYLKPNFTALADVELYLTTLEISSCSDGTVLGRWHDLL